MEDVTVDIGRPLNACNLKSMGGIEKVRVKPSLDTSWEALKDHRKIPNSLYLFSKIIPPEVVAHYLKDLASQGVDISEFSVDWLPENPPNFMKRQREPSEKSKKAKKEKLGETSASKPLVPLIESPISEAEMVNEPISSISFTPSSPPYYILSFDSEPCDPQSPPLAQLQARALALQQQPELEANTPPPEQPVPPLSEQPQTPPSEQPQNPPPEQPTTSPSDTPIIPPSGNIIIPTSQTPVDTNQTLPTSPSPDTELETTFHTLE
ncbi:uncharacterized protein LOC127122506 [Lathyrus oleraceus]|uniref:uncharacterized protein LOC127122506 n=1 Tax=Pisum sativum TaxID=3888 RepID=UPI0021CFACDB|nr:uncharacterized protein LOC127122506 [Pisum sativum]